MKIPPILDVGGVLISSDIITERFCCDLSKCKGICCVEGDAGAPVNLDEIGEIENVLDDVWSQLSPQAQAVIDRQGVVYNDRDGDLVTSIVGGKDCVFTFYDDITLPDGETVGNCCLCALEKSCCKPISCALYPIREKRFQDGTVALNYHRWVVCEDAVRKGRSMDLPVYRFLKGPLIRRFGEEWYQELCDVADTLTASCTPTD